MEAPKYVQEEGKVADWHKGEARHETCQYGELLPGTSTPAQGLQVETPTLVTGCTYPLKNLPPWVSRQAGTYVEFHRDCVICTCFKPVGGE